MGLIEYLLAGGAAVIAFLGFMLKMTRSQKDLAETERDNVVNELKRQQKEVGVQNAIDKAKNTVAAKSDSDINNSLLNDARDRDGDAN